MDGFSDAGHIDVIAFGESLALLSADTPGDLASVARFTRRLAGADSNVAIGLSRLGLTVDWTSRVGDDAFGRFVVDTLTAEGVNCEHVAWDPKRATGLQFKARRDDGGDPETLYFRRGSAASALSTAHLPTSRFARARHLHCTGIPAAISASARALCHHAITAMHAAGGTVSFDPNLRPALWSDETIMVEQINALAARADWVLPGLAEGRRLTGRDRPSAIADFYLEAGAGEVVVKLGAEGALWQSRAEGLESPGVAVERVVDSVGAGDGFAVGFISARLEQRAIASALARANAIAARVLGFAGDADGLPTRRELNESGVD